MSAPSTPMVRTPAASDDEDDGWSVGSDSTHDTVALDVAEAVNWEHDLAESLEGIADKRSFIREEALTKMLRILSLKYTHDVMYKRRTTLLDNLSKCLRDDREEKENILALRCLALVFITFGPDEANATAETFVPTAKYLITNHSSMKVKSGLLRLLALFTFIASQELAIGDLSGSESLQSTMLVFFSEVITTEGESVNAASDSGVLAASLNAYGLMWCAIWGQGQAFPTKDDGDTHDLITGEATDNTESESRSRAKEEFETVLPFHMEQLESHLVDVRVAAGENIALFFECLELTSSLEMITSGGPSGVTSPRQDAPITQHDLDTLTDRLSQLSTDSSKYTARSARKVQKSVFRDILRTVMPNMTQDTEHDADLLEAAAARHHPSTRKLKIGNLLITLKTWKDLMVMGAIKSALRSGLVTHFIRNAFVRDLFSSLTEVDLRSSAGAGGSGMPSDDEDDGSDTRSEMAQERKWINAEAKKTRQKDLKDKKGRRGIEEAQFLGVAE